jgi:D-alanyl-D-alanine carboxypeptidase (penicillin-binding protein 5/6)
MHFKFGTKSQIRYTKNCMKFIGNFLFWFFVFLVSSNFILASISYTHDKNVAMLSKIVSPLPRLLTNAFYKEVEASTFWQPEMTVKKTGQKELSLTAHAAIAYDTSTNTMLYAKDIDKRLPIASLTKIMTAMIALENLPLTKNITVTKSAATIGEDSMGLSEGETLSLNDLLYGLVLNSGNDAAEAIAQGSGLKREDYIHLMNKKAEDLGLSNTRFTNPTGLQGDGEQYSTAKELLVLTRYALQKEEFAKVAATYEYDIPQSLDHKAYTLYNETNLLTTYPGVKGVKTGFTDEAGMCLVTYLEYQGHTIIAVLLNSENRRQEMKDLLDYSLKQLNITPPPHS